MRIWRFIIDFETRHGNTTTGLSFGGPVAHLIGFILSVGVVLVAIIIGGLLIFGNIQDKKYDDYTVVQVEVVEKIDDAHYKVSYMIENKAYESKVFVPSDYEKGSFFDVYVNPDDYSDLYYKSNSDSSGTLIFIFVLLFALFTGVVSGKNHLNNFLHYINPSKYDLKNSKSHIAIGSGDVPSDTDIFDQGGDYSRWRF